VIDKIRSCAAVGSTWHPPMPDVWWGDDGIDALLWADPQPYKEPAESPVESAAIARAGEAR
jgi:hypothetical protein